MNKTSSDVFNGQSIIFEIRCHNTVQPKCPLYPRLKYQHGHSIVQPHEEGIILYSPELGTVPQK